MSNDINTMYKLTRSQKTILMGETFSFSELHATESNTIMFFFEVKGEHNNEALEKAFNSVIKINDALRLKIIKNGLKSGQYIKPYEYRKLDVVKVNNRDEFIKYNGTLHYNEPVPATGNELVWARIVDYGDGAAIVFRIHHICFDGYSIELVLKQMQTLYSAFENGEEEPKIRTGSIVDYFDSENKYLKSKQHTEDLKYIYKAYNTRLKYTIPGKRNVPVTETSIIDYVIDGEKYKKYQEISKEGEYPINFIFLAINALTVYKLKNAKSFGIPVLLHGRTTFQLKNTVGCLMTDMPVFFDIDIKKSVKEFFADEYKKYMNAMEHFNLSMTDKIIPTWLQGIKCGFNFNHSWMQYSVMGFINAVTNERFNGEVVTQKEIMTKFYESVLEKKDEKIEFHLAYQKKLFKQEEIQKILSTFDYIVNSVSEKPDRLISEL